MGGSLDFQDQVKALEKQFPRMAGEFAGFRNLENVLHWLKERNLSLGTIDVVNQDAYCHDLIIPLDMQGTHLVFGMT